MANGIVGQQGAPLSAPPSEETLDSQAGAVGASTPAWSDRDDTASTKNLADEHLVALHEVTKALTQEISVSASLRLITQKARHLTQCASCALALLDDERQMLDFAAVAGQGATEMVGQRVRVADALPGRTAVSGEPLLAYNPAMPLHPSAETEEVVLPAQDAASSFAEGGVRSAAVVPLFVEGNPIGSLAAINRIDGQSFGGSDLLVLHILASCAAAAVQRERLQRQNTQQERERDLLYEAARATSSTLNVQEILDGVLTMLAKSVGDGAAMVFLLNDDRTHLFIGAERGLSEEDRDVQLLADGKLATGALSSGPGGGAFLISDTQSDPRYEAIWPEDRVQPLSLLVAPLMSRESPMGLIVLASHQRSAYTAQDLRLLCAVAAQAAVALENAWLYEDATRRAEEATAIYELSQAVNTNLNLHRVLTFVADSVLALLHIDKFALFLHNPRTKALDMMVSRNIRRETMQNMHPTRQKGGIAWWVYEFETPTAVQNVSADHRNRSCPIDHEGVASLVSVPLQAGDEVIGVIHAMSSRRRLFTVGEMELLYTIANQVGVAISNIQMLDAARRNSAELRRSFRRVARAMGTSVDTSQTSQTVVDLAAEMMGAEKALLYTVEPAGRSLLLRAAHGLRLSFEEAGRKRAAVIDPATSAGWVARRGRSLIITDALTDTRFSPPDLTGPPPMRAGAYLGVPLKIGSEIMGVLEIYMREATPFSADQIRQFLAFAAQSAVALSNALLVEQAGRRRRDLQMLADLCRQMAQPDGRELLDDAIRLLVDTVDADGGAVVGQGLDITEEVPAWAKRPIAEAARRAIEANIIVQWPLEEPGKEPNEANDPCSIIAAPIDAKNGRSSVCVIRSAYRTPFDEHDVQLVQTVSYLLAPAL